MALFLSKEVSYFLFIRYQKLITMQKNKTLEKDPILLHHIIIYVLLLALIIFS